MKGIPKDKLFSLGDLWGMFQGVCWKILRDDFFSSYFGDRRSAMTQASTLVAWILLFLKMQVKVAAAGPKLPWKSHGHFFSSNTKCLLLVYTLQV